jgi:Predicted integral membrane protein (DUF2189)
MATVQTPARYAVRKIGSDDLQWALAEGWRDFQEKRGDLIFVALLYPAIGLIAAVLLFNDAALPLFFPVAAGLSILGPAVASGFYELARRREAGLEATWRHFFDPLFGPARDTLLMLTVGLMVIFGIWIAFAYGIYAATMGPDFPHGIAEFARRILSTPAGWAMILIGNLAGAVFAHLHGRFISDGGGQTCRSGHRARCIDPRVPGQSGHDHRLGRARGAAPRSRGAARFHRSRGRAARPRLCDVAPLHAARRAHLTAGPAKHRWPSPRDFFLPPPIHDG